MNRGSGETAKEGFYTMTFTAGEDLSVGDMVVIDRKTGKIIKKRTPGSYFTIQNDVKNGQSFSETILWEYVSYGKKR